MINPDLLNYIKQCLGRGMGQEEIRQALLKAGWQGSEVEESLRATGESKFLATAGAPAGSVSQSAQGVKSNKKIFLIVGAAVLVLVLGSGAYLWLTSSNKNQAGTGLAPKDDSKLSYLERRSKDMEENYKIQNPNATSEEIKALIDRDAKALEEMIDSNITACEGLPEKISKENVDQVTFKLSPFYVSRDQSIVYLSTEFGPFGCIYASRNQGELLEKVKNKADILALYQSMDESLIEQGTCSDLPEKIITASSTAFKDEDIGSLVYLPGTPGKIYAGLRSSCLYVSDDNGSTWKRQAKSKKEYTGFIPFDQGGGLFRIFTDPSNPNHLYNSLGMQTFDRGKNWERIVVEEEKTETIISNGVEKTKFSKVNLIELAVADDGKTLFMRTVASYGSKTSSTLGEHSATSSIYKSDDGGKKWVKILDYLDERGEPKQCGSLVIIDPLDSNNVLSGCSELYRSVDGGKSWVITLKDSPNNIFFGKSFIYGAGQERFFRSSDRGKTWVTKDTGLELWKFSVLSSNEKIIYATSFNNKLFKSEDGGNIWNEIELPITFDQYDVLVDVLVYEPSGKVFLATTKGLVVLPL